MRYLLSLAAVALLALSVDAATPEELDSAEKDIVGAWQLDFTTPDDVIRTPMIVVGRQFDELVAWYIEKDKPEAFKQVRLKDESLRLTFRPQERSDMTVTFVARLKKEGECSGTGTYQSDSGDSGSWEFEGERIAMSSFDEVQTWNLSFVTPDEQQHKAVVTVMSKNDKLYGWYSSKDFELPARELTMDDDKVVMLITTKTREGAVVDVTFRGTVSGDRVTGEAEYDLEGDTGSFAFSGERKS